jgi:ATPase subunit of ABC transporter with duplicated ATPase domains
MAQSRIKALEKMQKVSRVRQDADVVLTFPKPDIIPGPLIQLIDVSFGYTVPPATKPEKMLFSDVNLTIDAESRIALVRAFSSIERALRIRIRGSRATVSPTYYLTLLVEVRISTRVRNCFCLQLDL